MSTEALLSLPPLPHVKICGLMRHEDAAAALDAGARYGGVILSPESPRFVPGEQASEVFDGLSLRRVGVFVDCPEEEMLRSADVLQLDVLQLHGEEAPALLSRLRQRGHWALWKAVRPRSAEEFRLSLARYAGVVDGLLLDGWSAAGPGGTGTAFPWTEVARHRDRLPEGVSLIVAGGLTPENVAEAVRLLHPEVVDVSSGVEWAPGSKDPEVMRRFIEAAHGAGAPGEAGLLSDPRGA